MLDTLINTAASISAYEIVLYCMLALAPVILFTLLFISAPYGRHSRGGWGPTVNNRLGWLIMEAPAALVVLMIVLSQERVSAVILVFLALWTFHYFYRAFLYPFTLVSKRNMPVSVVMMAIVFNSINGYLIGFHFVHHSSQYEISWLWSGWFLVGVLLFFAGIVIVRLADRELARLQREAAGEYQIPMGYFYRLVSSPNYFGETIQWLGWALLTLSPAGFVFLCWTVANLLPRALTHHQWYQQHFDDYPRDRKAIFPGIL